MAFVESLSEKIGRINRIKKRAEMIGEMRRNDTFAFKTILQGFYDDRIVFELPGPGAPPYTPSSLTDQENVLLHDARKLKYFVRALSPNLKQTKRENIFIEMLETVTPNDAAMLIAMKDKVSPWKNITKAIVNEAFPGLCG